MTEKSKIINKHLKDNFERMYSGMVNVIYWITQDNDLTHIEKMKRIKKICDVNFNHTEYEEP
jgi:hypothetical protein